MGSTLKAQEFALKAATLFCKKFTCTQKEHTKTKQSYLPGQCILHFNFKASWLNMQPSVFFRGVGGGSFPISFRLKSLK